MVDTPCTACRFAELLCKMKKRMQGRVTRWDVPVEENPEGFGLGDACLVRMVPTKPLCVESFDEYPALGRFAVRDMTRTIGIGLIKSVSKIH